MNISLHKFGALAILVSLCVCDRAQAQSGVRPDPPRSVPSAPASAEPQAASQEVASPSQVVPVLPVPRLIKFSGVVKDASGQRRSGVVGLTFSIYDEQEDGATLWMETQNVELDEQGRYAALLGTTQSAGMPLELFVSGEPRWLGVRAELPGELEQARVLLVSVPYALKAADADTLGGKPASAYLLAPSEAGAPGGGHGVSGLAGTSRQGASAPTGPVADATITGSGTTNQVAKFTPNGTTVGNSAITEVNGNVGINTTSPGVMLDVVGGSIRTNKQLVSTLAVGIAPFLITSTTMVPNLNAATLGGNAASAFALLAATKNTFTGSITASSFTGAGSGITSVNAAQLGGLASSAFAQLSAVSNTFTGSVAASSFSGSGSGLTNVNAGQLGGLAPSVFAQLGASSNAFTGSITATSFSGSGAGLANVNAGQLGGLAPSAFAQLGAASNTFTGSITATSFSGSGAGLANVNAGQLGGLAPSAFAQLGAASNTFTGSITASSFGGSGAGLSNVNAGQLGGLTASAFSQLGAASNTFTGGITATSFSGSGAGLANVNAGQLGGLIPGAFAQLGASSNTFTGGITATSFSGNGAGLSNVNAAMLGGNLASVYSTTGQTDGRYLQLTGGALGGALSGTSTSFSGTGSFGGLLTGAGGVWLPATGTAGAGGGYNSSGLGLVSSAYNSGSGTAEAQTFQWQAEPVGNNTAGATGQMSLLYGAGTNSPAETGLTITAGGVINFASGQTFPGMGSNGGTVTNVGTGLGLTGGPITTTGTVMIDPTVVPLLGANNTFTGSNTFTGTSNSFNGSFTGNGSGLSNVNAGQLGGLTASAFSQLGAASNTFTGGITATSFSGSGAGLANVNAGQLGGLIPGAFAQLGASSNTFTGGITATSFSGNGAGLSNVNALMLGGNLASVYSTTGQTDARYLQLTGGTLGGALSGTSSSFSGAGSFGGLLTGTGGVWLPATGTAGAGGGYNSSGLGLVSSAYNSGSGTAVAQTFQWQAEPVGNNTAGATGQMSLLYGAGTNSPAETGLTITAGGVINFASGQTFPGMGSNGGTVTNVGTGLGLTGGPVTTTGTVMIDPTVVPLLGANNTFTGSITATSFSGSGAGLANVNAGQLGGLAPGAFAQLGAASNTFTGGITALSFSGSGAGLSNVNALMLGGNLATAYSTTWQTDARYLQLTGGALGGALSGTSSSFSGAGSFGGLLTGSGGVWLPATGTAGAGGGYNSSGLGLVSSAYNSGSGTAEAQTFQWQAEPVGNNTAGATGQMSLLYGAGTNAPAETGLTITAGGVINFASGQTFPGMGSNGGTVTNVGTGLGLTGGPVTTAGTVMIDPTVVPLLGANNTFTGSITATSFSGSGSGLANVNAGQLGGFAPSAFAQLGAGSNTFTGSITATTFSGNGAGLSNVNAGQLNGLAPSAFAQLGAASNTFTGGITATSFSGSGAGLSNVNAAELGGLAPGAFAQVGAGGTGFAKMSGTQVLATVSSIRSLVFQIGTPGGPALSPGLLGYVTVPFGCSIAGWSIQVDAGTATVKTLKVASGTATPTLASNSISTSGVSISAGTVIQSATLTDFTTTTVTANDILAADIVAVAGAGYLSFQLSCSQ